MVFRKHSAQTYWMLLLTFMSAVFIPQAYYSNISNLLQTATRDIYNSPNTSNVMLKCIRSYDGPTDEGIGAIITRNNLLFYLSHMYESRVSWAPQNSSHRYDIQKFFSSCPEPPPSCVLKQREVIIPSCPRGNCSCMWLNAYPVVQSFAERCEVMGIRVDFYRSTEYFGCFRKSIIRYFVHEKPPAFEYDAIHYRMGDLAWKPGEKSLSPWELQNTLHQFCLLSTRPLVIVTEGKPKIPMVPCWNRIILACDTSLKDAFTIMHHAKIISVGDSTFAFSLAEVSSPERIVVLQRSVEKYEWMHVQNWTVLDAMGIAFHFTDKNVMLEGMLSETRHKARLIRYPGDWNATYEFKVPSVTFNDSFWSNAT